MNGKGCLAFFLTLVLLFCFVGCDFFLTSESNGEEPTGSSAASVEHKPVTAPVHFAGLQASSVKADVKRLYGEPDEVREAIYPEGAMIDVYRLTYLDVQGDMEFFYFNDDAENLFRATFTVDSDAFSSAEDYRSAVNRTYDHFSGILTANGYTLSDEDNEEKLSVHWTRSDLTYAYSAYATEMHDGDFQHIRECTVFQFNKLIVD